MDIVGQIQTLLETKGMTIKALELELGFGNGTIRRWNKNSPSCDKLLLVANLLRTNVDYLLTGEEKEKTLPPPQLHEDESELLEVYRRLTKGSQKRMIGFGYDEIDRAKQEQAATAAVSQNAG